MPKWSVWIWVEHFSMSLWQTGHALHLQNNAKRDHDIIDVTATRSLSQLVGNLNTCPLVSRSGASGFASSRQKCCQPRRRPHFGWQIPLSKNNERRAVESAGTVS